MTKKKNKYRSGFEEKFAANLDKQGIEYHYETKSIEYTVKRRYYLDFDLKKLYIYIETKGYFKASDRTKHLAIKAQHPDVDIRFVFMADNKLSKKSKTRYSEWCLKHGFKYTISPKGEFPKEWLKEKKKNG